jgi:23S rRNA pseudouridine1911/1915/1917 synthase
LDAGRRITYSATVRDRGKRLDLFLKERIPRMSRERIKEAIRTRVEVAGRGTVRPATELNDGDRVIVTYPNPGDVGAADPVPILFEDPHLLAVDKPSGLLVHGTASSRGPDLLSRLTAAGGPPLHLVHRLDRETSGVLVLGKTVPAARALSELFAARGARKTYMAVVFGAVRDGAGEIDLPLGRARSSAVHIKQGVDREGGYPARTRYRVLVRLDGFTVLELIPLTGRRHQLRVHLQALGHPVVGDKLYGARESHHLRYLAGGFDDGMRRELLAERQLLHARRLEIPHPVGGRKLDLVSPIPKEIRAFIRRPPVPDG